MSPLRELQADVMDALFERPDRALQHIAGNGLAARERLDIYRHNLFESLTAALAAVYPTVEQLVGRGFFRYAAHDYILAHPSRSGNLHDFGDALPEFLAQFEPARSLPYLPDSARLDWAWHQVFHSEAAPAANPAEVLARIAALPDEARARLRLRWQPAARLVASRFPVLRIWQVHQQPIAEGGDGGPLVDIDAGGECVLIVVRHGDVMLERLSRAEHGLLAAFADGATLGEAVAEVLAIDGGFDVAASIAHHLAVGTLLECR